jgi:O-antigen/teichoic acid export membrane protein
MHRVVFPRFSRAYRQGGEELSASFRGERQKFVPYFLFAGGAFLIAGDLVFQILFDPRYREGGVFFSLLMLRPILMALALPAEQCLIAAGRIRVALISNIMRTVWLLAGVALGYSFLGIYGVILAVATTDIIPLVYLWWQLGKIMPVNLRYEAISILFILAGLGAGWVLKTLIMASGFVDALIAV